MLKMAWRDSRASRRRLLLYSASVMLGIAGLVAVQSYGVNLRAMVDDEPRRLLGGDVRIGLGSWPNQPLSDFLAAARCDVAREKVFPSPLAAASGSAKRRVLVDAIDPNFPFFGSFTTDVPGALERLRRGEKVALVDPQVAQNFHLKAGDTIEISAGKFEVAGVVKEYPGESSLMLLFQGRVFVPWSAAVAAPTPRHPAERGQFRLYLRLPAGGDGPALAEQVKGRFASDLPTVMTQQQLRQEIDDAIVKGSDYVSLVIFVGLLLGGIGIASSLNVYIQERLVRVAVMRCLGCGAWRATAVYAVQAGFIGVCGSIGGALLGVAAQFALPAATRDLLPADVRIFFAWRPIFEGMGTGFVLCLAFALIPLLSVRRASPLAVLRAEAAEPVGRDPLRLASWALIVAGAAYFAREQMGHWKVALAFTACLAVVFGLFAAAALALSQLSRLRLPKILPFSLRQGVANLHRPRNRTVLLTLSLGMGSFIMLTVSLVRSTLIARFSSESTPNLYLGEIRYSEVEGLRELAGKDGLKVMSATPVVDVELKSVNGKEPRKEAPRGRRAPTNHFKATFRDHLLDGEKTEAGEFVARARPGEPVIPIAIARWMTLAEPRLKLGDEAIWSVDGVPLKTRIAEVHSVQGIQFDPHFPIVFPAGPLDAAPADAVMFLRSPNGGDTARFEQDLRRASPKAQDFDLTLMVQILDRVFGRIATLIDLVASVTLGTGIVILASAVAAGRHQRARESVLLRSIGASRAQMRAIQFFEYASVGVLAGALGCGLAWAANAALCKFLLKLPPGGGLEAAGAAGLMVAATVATGVLADRGASRLSPLEILREET